MGCSMNAWEGGDMNAWRVDGDRKGRGEPCKGFRERDDAVWCADERKYFLVHNKVHTSLDVFLQMTCFNDGLSWSLYGNADSV